MKALKILFILCIVLFTAGIVLFRMSALDAEGLHFFAFLVSLPSSLFLESWMNRAAGIGFYGPLLLAVLLCAAHMSLVFLVLRIMKRRKSPRG